MSPVCLPSAVEILRRLRKGDAACQTIARALALSALELIVHSEIDCHSSAHLYRGAPRESPTSGNVYAPWHINVLWQANILSQRTFSANNSVAVCDELIGKGKLPRKATESLIICRQFCSLAARKRFVGLVQAGGLGQGVLPECTYLATLTKTENAFRRGEGYQPICNRIKRVQAIILRICEKHSKTLDPKLLKLSRL